MSLFNNPLTLAAYRFVVGVGSVHRCHELGRQRMTERIALVWIVERNREDPSIVERGFNECHDLSSRAFEF